jgi:hypothetical protein
MLKSAMTVAAQVSPESTLKGGGTGRAHDRSRNSRGTSPSAPSASKRCRSVSESYEAQVESFEGEDQFEEDPDFAPRRRELPSLKALIDSDAAEDIWKRDVTFYFGSFQSLDHFSLVFQL